MIFDFSVFRKLVLENFSKSQLSDISDAKLKEIYNKANAKNITCPANYALAILKNEIANMPAVTVNPVAKAVNDVFNNYKKQQMQWLNENVVDKLTNKQKQEMNEWVAKKVNPF